MPTTCRKRDVQRGPFRYQLMCSGSSSTTTSFSAASMWDMMSSVPKIDPIPPAYRAGYQPIAKGKSSSSFASAAAASSESSSRRRYTGAFTPTPAAQAPLSQAVDGFCSFGKAEGAFLRHQSRTKASCSDGASKRAAPKSLAWSAWSASHGSISVTLRYPRAARYAARNVGFTAVPVIHGGAAVVTITIDRSKLLRSLAVDTCSGSTAAASFG
mmetsp:Transcript_18936/g.58371  ORF Transcript_18936/g.58371 Transcript_18936/m.58371 type:complete len:213 (-) Transcript_18936:209-847(-)